MDTGVPPREILVDILPFPGSTKYLLDQVRHTCSTFTCRDVQSVWTPTRTFSHRSLLEGELPISKLVDRTPVLPDRSTSPRSLSVLIFSEGLLVSEQVPVCLTKTLFAHPSSTTHLSTPGIRGYLKIGGKGWVSL